MPKFLNAGECGVHRFRAVFFSNQGRLLPSREPSEGEQVARLWLRECVRNRRAASFVIADCRLLEPTSPMIALMPPSVRARLGAVLPGAGALPRNGGVMPRVRSLGRRVLPWAVAMATATAGFWVFFHRAL